MDRNDTSNKAQRAIGLLKEQLERDGSDLSQAIAELCAAHPDLEAVLETLGSAYRAGQAATASRSLHELVRTRLGDPDTITFVLEPEDESNTGSAGEATDVERTAVDAGLGRYSVQDEVARGGMGVIYRVRDKELNRTLAMKVMAGMPPESSDVSAVNVLSRFLEEAQLTAQLDHPGIVAVHELGVDARGRPFFTMKLVRGREYSKIVRLVHEQREGWNLSRAVGILVKVCQTIAYAHAKHVIHRDLKSANIMVGRFGEVYAMDWGLAKVVGRQDLHDLRFAPEADMTLTAIRTPRSGGDSATADSPLVTMDGSVVGTPAFMAPEQARGNVDAVDHQSDIYSLGAVLYHLLTGQPPYVEPGARVSQRTILARVLDGPPKPTSKLNPQVPAELAAICEKAMARDKPDRYGSSLDLAEDLQAWLDRRVVRAYQTGPLAEFKSWVNRNRLAATVSAAALAVLLLVAAWWTYQEHNNSLLLRHRLSQQYLRQGQVMSEAGRIDQGLHWFVRASQECPSRDTALQADIEANLFLWSQRCNRLLQMIDHEVELAKPFPQQQPMPLAFSPDGSQLVTGGYHDHTARIWSIETGSIVGNPMEHGAAVIAAFFSATGEQIITASADSSLRFWSATGKPVQDPIQLDSKIASITFHPSTSVVAVGTGDGTVMLWSAVTGQPIGEPLPYHNSVTALTFSSDGQRVLAGYLDSTARVWSVATSQPLGDALHDLHGIVMDFSPDGSAILIVNEEGAAQLWSVELAKPIGAPLRHDAPITLAKFSPDGAVVATWRGGFVARLWSAKDGTAIGPPLDHGSTVIALAFSPDSQLLLTGSVDLSARLWSVKTGRRVGTAFMKGSVVSSVAFSSDGSKIAIGSGGQADVWSASVLPKPKVVYPTAQDVWGIDFHPSGHQVVTGGFVDRLRIWSKEPAELLLEFPNLGNIWVAEFSPDGQRLVVGYGFGQHAARLWSHDGKEVAVLDHKNAVRSAAFNSDGTQVATGSFDQTAKVWNARTGELLSTFAHPGIVEDLVFGPDGVSLLTACDDGKVRTWSLKDEKEVRAPLEHNDAVLAIDLSPDGRLIATGSRNQTARFWETATGKLEGAILEHASWVEDISFSANGRFVVTGCADGNVQVWSVETREKIGPPWLHSRPVRSVAFDPSGEHVLTGAEEPGAKLWAVSRPAPVKADDLEIWVRAMTGKRMDENGVISRLSPSEWRVLQSAYSKKASHLLLASNRGE